MKRVSFLGLLILSSVAAGCAFESTSELFAPTSPSELAASGGSSTGSATGGSSSTGSGGSSGSTATPASAFAGAWGSPTFAGLPLGNCADVKWIITAQSASSVSGTVTATCASGVNVAANLTGTLQSDSVINLAANGNLTAMGLPCAFTLNGTGTRQAGDTMKVDYNGNYCFGTVSGTETLRRFPNI